MIAWAGCVVRDPSSELPDHHIDPPCLVAKPRTTTVALRCSTSHIASTGMPGVPRNVGIASPRRVLSTPADFARERHDYDHNGEGPSTFKALSSRKEVNPRVGKIKVNKDPNFGFNSSAEQ